MTVQDRIASKIIKEQELIIGPLAWVEASSVHGLTIIDKKSGEVVIANEADRLRTVDELVSKYVDLFGRASREVCKEAVAGIIADLPPEEIPSSLR